MGKKDGRIHEITQNHTNSISCQFVSFCGSALALDQALASFVFVTLVRAFANGPMFVEPAGQILLIGNSSS
jgi:hypothetical protein